MTYYHLTLIINNQLKYYPAMANPNNYNNKTITDFIDDEGFLDTYIIHCILFIIVFVFYIYLLFLLLLEVSYRLVQGLVYLGILVSFLDGL